MKLLRIDSRFLVTAATVLASLTSALAGNLLSNANFEQIAATGLPEGWTVFCPAPTGPGTEGLAQGNKGMYALDSETLYKEKPALRISSIDRVRVGFVQSKLSVKPGQKLRFSCWIKGEAIKTSTNAGAWVRLSVTNNSDPSKNSTAYKSSGFLKSRKETFDWSFFEDEVVVPAEADSVELGLFLWHTSGTAWFACPSLEVVE